MVYSLARRWTKLDIRSLNYKIYSAVYPLISPHCLRIIPYTELLFFPSLVGWLPGLDNVDNKPTVSQILCRMAPPIGHVQNFLLEQTPRGINELRKNEPSFCSFTDRPRM